MQTVPTKMNGYRINAIVAHTSIKGSNVEDIHARILKAAESSEIIAAPEYAYHPGRPLIPEERSRYLDELAQASHGRLIVPGTFVWQEGGLMHNTAYAIADGTIIHEYDKINQCGEDKIADACMLKPVFGKKPALFTWDKKRCGIEICADTGTLT
ncbi:MAG: hypothetical protein HGA85_06540, partial [Nanoarchaeota archaeon]|nr:hypothetical protein [Nanoarchaeota archaeon]